MTTSRHRFGSFALLASGFFAVLITLSGVARAEDAPGEEVLVPAVDILDSNGDGILDPYEALDALLTIQKELDGKPVTLEALAQLEAEWAADEESEVSELFDQLDEDGDGRLSRDEMDEDILEYEDVIDSNKDGFITPEEIMAVEDLDPMFMDEDEIEKEVNSIFAEYDRYLCSSDLQTKNKL